MGKRIVFFLLLSISVLTSTTAIAITINGNVLLEGETTHGGIAVHFNPTTPSGEELTVTTASSGSFTANVASGYYDVYFSMDGFGAMRLQEQNCYSTTTLESVTLPIGFSGEHIRGDVSGTLFAGTYIADSSLVVPERGELTILPGTRIVFEHENSLFLIEGEINAQGTESDSIWFMSQPGYSSWRGFKFDGSSSDSSYFDYVMIQGATENVIRTQGSSAIITHSVFCDNHSTEDGSILYQSSGKVRLIDCHITQNTGRTLFRYGYPNLLLRRCVIANNTTSQSLMSLNSSSETTIQNCLIQENESAENGLTFDGTTINIRNTIFYGNTGKLNFINDAEASVTYSCFYNNVRGDFNDGGACPANLGEIVTTNANNDPCDAFNNIFMDPMVLDEEFYLLPDSPCIDAGDPESPDDPDGSVADIGVYPFNTDTPYAPFPFLLLEPYPGDYVWDSDGALLWQETEDINPTDTPCYDVWFSSSSDFSVAVQVADSIEVTTLNFASIQETFPFSDNTVYYWKVRATDNNTAGRWSSNQGEFTFSPNPISPYDLTGSLDDVTGQVHLSWSNGQYTGDRVELAYDPEAVTISYYWIGNTMAVAMHPERACQLLELKYFTLVQTGGNEFIAEVYPWGDGQPSTNRLYDERVTASNWQWNSYDVSSENLVFAGDFVVGFGSLSQTTCLSTNENYNSGHSWGLEGGSWNSRDKTYLIRAVVRYVDTGELAMIAPSMPQSEPSVTSKKPSHPSTDPVGVANPAVLPVSDELDDFESFNVYRNDELIGETSSLVFNDLLSQPGDYAYRIRAQYSNGESAASNVYNCGYYPNTPSSFSLLSPNDGDTVRVSLVLLAWQRATDDDPDDTPHYDVWLDTLEDMSTAQLVGDSLSATSLAVEEVAPGYTYYWTVRATDTNSGGTWATNTWSFVRPSTGTGVDSREAYIPTEYSLSEAYPNPFNASTKMTIGLPVRSHVRVEVFDVLGRSVALLQDREIAAGMVNLAFDAGEFASGIYFVKAEVPGKMREIKKIVLVR